MSDWEAEARKRDYRVNAGRVRTSASRLKMTGAHGATGRERTALVKGFCELLGAMAGPDRTRVDFLLQEVLTIRERLEFICKAGPLKEGDDPPETKGEPPDIKEEPPEIKEEPEAGQEEQEIAIMAGGRSLDFLLSPPWSQSGNQCIL